MHIRDFHLHVLFWVNNEIYNNIVCVRVFLSMRKILNVFENIYKIEFSVRLIFFLSGIRCKRGTEVDTARFRRRLLSPLTLSETQLLQQVFSRFVIALSFNCRYSFVPLLFDINSTRSVSTILFVLWYC